MENLSNLPLDAVINKLIDLVVSFGGRLLVAIIVFFIGRWLIKRIINLVVKGMQRRKVEASLFTRNNAISTDSKATNWSPSFDE